MQTIDLAARERTSRGSGAARRFRRQGQVPAIMYGHGDPLAILVDARTLDRALHTSAGSNAIMNLKIGAQTEQLAIIRDIQRHPVTRQLAHVDFLRVSLTETIKVDVPVEIVGTAPAVKSGGVLILMLREIQVEATPLNIPDSIKVDVSKLENIHDAIHVRELLVSEGVEILTDAEVTIVSIQPPKEEEAAPVAAEGAAGAVPGAAAASASGEPEVLAKGKEKGEKEEASKGKEGKA